MGGRGRGRGRGGAAVSFNIEQLGLTKGDDVPCHLKPPPIYPPPENRPFELNNGIEEKYLLTVHKELNIRMKSSPFHLVTTNVVKKGIESFYDRKYNNPSHLDKELPVQWDRMPSELRISKAVVKKRKATTTSTKRAKQKRDVDPSQILSKLEDMEKTESEAEDEITEKKKEDDEDDPKEDREDDDDEELEDEELDDGTDYANQYFDNGEGYLDDDDNLDDEAVY